MGIFVRLMRRVPEPELSRTYGQRIWRLLKRRPSPLMLHICAIKCAMHYHANTMVQQMQSGVAINSF